MPATTITTRDLCLGLGIARARVDQLISRAIFVPGHTPAPGMAREWSFADAVDLAVRLDIADTFRVPLTPGDDGGLFIRVRDVLRRGYLYEGGDTYLVISRQPVSLVPATERGAPARPPTPAGLSQHVYPRIVAEAELAATLAEVQHTPAIVINLNAVEARLLEFWPRGDA